MYDPLLEIEQQHAVSSKQSSRFTHSRIFRTIRFVWAYFMLTGVIFGIIMGILNFSAYSARVINWINPETITHLRDQIQLAVSNSSVAVYAQWDESRESLETVRAKVELTDPEVIYSRSYPANGLLSWISRTSSEATFSVVPHENRIIIPRLGKNIPLVDVHNDAKSSYDQMHETFMEELKKWVVRYPWTAQPWDVGNAFIFGHSSNYPWVKSDYNDVLALIDTMKVGDEIIVYYNQKKFVYKVTDHSVVKPWDTKVLSSRDPKKKEISLMTCWPIGTTLERYIVFWELIETSKP